MRGARLLRAAALSLALAVVSTGCSSEAPEKSDPSTSPSAVVSSAPPPPAAPKVGDCHRLTFEEATAPVESRPQVRCSSPHTAVTIKVGRIDALADGHLLAVDSATVRAQIARACPPALEGFVGGDENTRRLSRFEVVWYSPSLEQAEAGADWYRCDVVALRSEGELMTLPARMRGVLDRPGALDRFGTCGTSAPDRPSFERVACSERHNWRAVDTIDLPPGTRFQAQDAGAAADRECQDIAAARAGDSLRYTWSFEWPSRAAWDEGQRYGYCWVPN